MTKQGFAGACARLSLAAIVLFLFAEGRAPGAQEREVVRLPERPRAAHKAPVLLRPDGSRFFLDPNLRGLGGELLLSNLSWGRLVDVHGLRDDGSVDPAPAFRDFVIGEDIRTDGVDYVLQRNAATQVERLIVLREPGAAEPTVGARTFIQLVRIAAGAVTSVRPRPDDGTGAPPFSVVSRNATLVARFADLLDDSETALAELVDTVRIFTGYPPNTPFQARLFFDRNFGGLAGGEFHSTRVLIDLTVSEVEAAGMVVPVPINALGLPASVFFRRDPNVSIRIPTRVDPGSGQLALLRSLGGAPLSSTGNGPVDLASPTRDVVRALRSGNSRDAGNGFLADEEAPQLLGAFPLTVTGADDLPAGELGAEFVLNLAFAGACRARPLRGDVIQVGALFLDVLMDGNPPDAGGAVTGVLVRTTRSEPAIPDDLLGLGLFVTSFRPGRALDAACWVQFAPQPDSPPDAGVTPSSQVLLRFSEPLLPESVRPFDTLRLIRGTSGAPPGAADIVVSEVRPSADLREFSVTPLLPLAHQEGSATPYHLDLGDIRDLGGNPLLANPQSVDFTLDPGAPSESNGGIVMRFASGDELEPQGLLDLRGQFFYDLDRELLRPRDLVRTSYAADRTAPVGSLMIPWPFGSQLPLTPLGSKVQSVWRYADFGWQVEDDTKLNLDIEGLAWAPQSGQVVADFFEEFEIRLGHANRLPDEAISIFLLPRYPNSGLRGPPALFADNFLDDPAGGQRVVHPRALGYAVDPADQFVSPTGTVMMPYPLNRGPQPRVTYTWRDTAVTATAGDNGAGIPMDVEVGPPLFLEPVAGYVAPAGEIPTLGLPLLLEFRTYPSDTGLGLNRFDLSLAINSSSRPTFRAFSAGGVDTTGSVVTKDPDLELTPSGGFNPASIPPGQPSRPTDNLVYLGQIDVINRVSRVHSVWIDTQLAAPDYVGPLIESSTPSASALTLEYRGATGFSADAGTDPFNALRIDAYGNPRAGEVLFLAGDSSWTADIHDLNGARYVQFRIAFESDTTTREFATLDGLGIAFSE